MAEKRFLVCGGCGFIGSNFIRHLLQAFPEAKVVVYDLLTYAGSLENLQGLSIGSRLFVQQGDICNRSALENVFSEPFDLVINFAAETHVDRSLFYTTEFVRTNVLGTEILLSLCRDFQTRFLQISTDEVYGPAGDDCTFDESAALNPSSPYAASKASADLLVLSALKTLGQPAGIVRTSNNYGPRQFPEKLIPYFLHLIQEGNTLPVYGDGMQRRSWFHVEDFCQALLKIVADFPGGEIFNIGASREYTNLEVVRTLLELTSSHSAIVHVADRPAHDRRYRMDCTRFVSRFGRIPERDFQDGLKSTITWYQENSGIFQRLRSESAQSFQDLNYHNRQ